MSKRYFVGRAPDLTKLITYQPINNNPIIIYESTVYPGATEEVCLPILKKHSKLQHILRRAGRRPRQCPRGNGRIVRDRGVLPAHEAGHRGDARPRPRARRQPRRRPRRLQPAAADADESPARREPVTPVAEIDVSRTPPATTWTPESSTSPSTSV